MPEIRVSAASLGVRVERVLRVLAVVSAHHHGSEIGSIVDHLREGIGSLDLEVLRETFGELKEGAVVDRIGAAIEHTNASKVHVDTSGMPIVGYGGAIQSACQRNFGLPIDVAGTSKMLPSNAEITKRYRIIF